MINPPPIPNKPAKKPTTAPSAKVTTEMVLFEWLHQAGTEEFRAMLPLIK